MPESQYNDYNGVPLNVGDRIEHPDGDIGTVVYDKKIKDEYRRWRVKYSDLEHSLWLGLQVGDKGQAVRIEPTSKER